MKKCIKLRSTSGQRCNRPFPLFETNVTRHLRKRQPDHANGAPAAGRQPKTIGDRQPPSFAWNLFFAEKRAACKLIGKTPFSALRWVESEFSFDSMEKIISNSELRLILTAGGCQAFL